ncbi:MAG TPA: cyclic nucleotide-binding domain-containing protein [Myxococcota bacterium]|nr:cyclic nucleotide-binding domain-containing protein [Myxococcota bacterium]
MKAKFFAKTVSLPVEGLKKLRVERNPVYKALLEQALLTLSRRIRSVDLSIAKVGAGALDRPKREASFTQKMWRKLVPGKPRGACPPLIPLLKKQPGLKLLEDHQLEKIAAGWEPVAHQEGEVVFLEGERGDSAYLVADGEIEVIRNVRGDKAQRLAVLLAGDTFGINTLIEPGTRSASCVAGGPTWAYRISSKAFRSPRGDSGTLWKESILAALASQIRAANLALNRAKKVPPPPGGRRADSPEAFRQLLLAHGLIGGLPLSEHSVDLAV